MNKRKLGIKEGNQVPTLVYFLVDKSGSMDNRRKETVDAFNEYISGLKKNAGDVKFLFSLKTFNIGGTSLTLSIDTIVDKQPIANVKELTLKDYNPFGGTPLYDAIGNTVDEIVRGCEDNKNPVLFIIQTDGEENSSQRYKKADIAKLVEEKTKNNWQFLFLGCAFDNMAEGQAINVAPANNISFSQQDYANTYNRLAYASSNYLKTAEAAPSVAVSTNFMMQYGGESSSPEEQFIKTISEDKQTVKKNSKDTLTKSKFESKLEK